MANKSVIDYTVVTTTASTDWLYLLRGTGSDRDKRVMLATLFSTITTPVDANATATKVFRIRRSDKPLIDTNNDDVEIPSASVALGGVFKIGTVELQQSTTDDHMGLTASSYLNINAVLSVKEIRARFARLTTDSVSATALATVATLRARKTGTAAEDGFGASLQFTMIQETDLVYAQGFLAFRRDGANNTHKAMIVTNRNGVSVAGLEVFGTVVNLRGRSGQVRRITGEADGDNDKILPTDAIVFLTNTTDTMIYIDSTAGWRDGQIVEVYASTAARVDVYMTPSLYWRVEGMLNGTNGLILVYDAVTGSGQFRSNLQISNNL